MSIPKSLCFAFAPKVSSTDFSFENSSTASLLAAAVQHCGQYQQPEKVVAGASNTLQKAHNQSNFRTIFANVKLVVKVSVYISWDGRNGRRHARTETMLCWIRADPLCGYKAPVKHERIRDRYAGSRHLRNIRF